MEEGAYKFRELSCDGPRERKPPGFWFERPEVSKAFLTPGLDNYFERAVVTCAALNTIVQRHGTIVCGDQKRMVFERNEPVICENMAMLVFVATISDMILVSTAKWDDRRTSFHANTAIKHGTWLTEQRAKGGKLTCCR